MSAHRRLIGKVCILLQGLIPKLLELLRCEKNSSAVLKLLTAFVLSAGSNYQNVLGPILGDILLATSKSISKAYSATVDAAASGDRIHVSSSPFPCKLSLLSRHASPALH